MTAEEYLSARVDDQIDWYDSKSLSNQRWFKRLRLAEITAAATIPLLAGFQAAERSFVPPIMGILGAVVAVIAGALGLFQFEHHWIEYRTTCESLKREKFLFLTGADPFDEDPPENHRLLVQRVEALLAKENTSWAQSMMKPREKSDHA